jgi:hypothetical protein
VSPQNRGRNKTESRRFDKPGLFARGGCRQDDQLPCGEAAQIFAFPGNYNLIIAYG